jgi:hypothetical protein
LLLAIEPKALNSTLLSRRLARRFDCCSYDRIELEERLLNRRCVL